MSEQMNKWMNQSSQVKSRSCKRTARQIGIRTGGRGSFQMRPGGGWGEKGCCGGVVILRSMDVLSTLSIFSYPAHQGLSAMSRWLSWEITHFWHLKKRVTNGPTTKDSSIQASQLGAEISYFCCNKSIIYRRTHGLRNGRTDKGFVASKNFFTKMSLGFIANCF